MVVTAKNRRAVYQLHWGVCRPSAVSGGIKRDFVINEAKDDTTLEGLGSPPGRTLLMAVTGGVYDHSS